VNAYEEAVYFHPFVLRFLYPQASASRNGGKDRSGEPPLRVYRSSDVIRQVDLTLSSAYGTETSRHLRLSVDRANLYVFDAGLVLLAVEVSSGDGKAVTPFTLFPMSEGNRPIQAALQGFRYRDILRR
jgi:hypothetical protein